MDNLLEKEINEAETQVEEVAETVEEAVEAETTAEEIPATDNVEAEVAPSEATEPVEEVVEEKVTTESPASEPTEQAAPQNTYDPNGYYPPTYDPNAYYPQGGYAPNANYPQGGYTPNYDPNAYPQGGYAPNGYYQPQPTPVVNPVPAAPVYQQPAPQEQPQVEKRNRKELLDKSETGFFKSKLWNRIALGLLLLLFAAPVGILIYTIVNFFL